MGKHKNSKEGPAAQRYKSSNRLKTNKLRRIAKAQGVDLIEAEKLWDQSKEKVVEDKKNKKVKA